MEGLDISSLLAEYPEFLRTKDLIRIGLFRTKFAVRNAQRKGNAPPSIKINFNRILFPKNSLIEWLEERNRKNLEIDNDSTK
jgi:hypothetical protein